VIGAGFSGLTAALLLQRAGKRVVVLEKEKIGHGESGLTTAHLTAFLDLRYHVLCEKFGLDGARLAAHSTLSAIEQIEHFAKRGECDFRRVPAFLSARTPAQREELEREREAMAKIGLRASWGVTLPGMGDKGALRLERQGQLHPLKYLAILAREFTAAGGRIFENTEMTEVIEEDPCRVETRRGHVQATDVLVLTHVPVINRLLLLTKVAAYRSYAVAGKIPSGVLEEALHYDLDEPYHYVRRYDLGDQSYAIVGGADHKTGQNSDTKQSFAEVEAFASTLFLDFSSDMRWSGQILEPTDGLPFIGRNPGQEHVYVATGFSGNGMTFGTIAAMILSDAIKGVENPWADLYAAARIKPLAQAARFLSENIDYARYLAGDFVDTGNVTRVDDIAREAGRTLRVKGKMIAAYRDEHGELHTHSAVCTHLGCNVHFNAAEKTWDCPCHGGRFDIHGQVVNGPPIKALEAVEIEEKSEPIA
jgi:glycine/D-amino acid oxidase-like deaminating enzyme/nitrite reductase/ring-hydroxylating ferredoxin subunit